LATDTPSTRRQYASAIILLWMRWYVRYSLSYRDLAEMLAERGLPVDHTTIDRWVPHAAPALEKRGRAPGVGGDHGARPQGVAAGVGDGITGPPGVGSGSPR
jgi:hypothetical protein